MQLSSPANALSFSVFQNTNHGEKKLLIAQAIFSEQYHLNWNESSHLKWLLFRKMIFFRIPSCLKQLLFNNYFLLINTFSDQLLLKDKYFSVQMLLRRSYFFRISNCLEHVLFRGRQFCQTVTFSEEEYF